MHHVGKGRASNNGDSGVQSISPLPPIQPHFDHQSITSRYQYRIRNGCYNRCGSHCTGWHRRCASIISRSHRPCPGNSELLSVKDPVIRECGKHTRDDVELSADPFSDHLRNSSSMSERKIFVDLKHREIR